VPRERRSWYTLLDISSLWILDLVNKEKCTRQDYKELAKRSAERRQEISNTFARAVSEAIECARHDGADDLNAIAEYLNQAGLKTLRGGSWRGNQVKRQLDCLR
jgi:hypothetical protein